MNHQQINNGSIAISKSQVRGGTVNMTVNKIDGKFITANMNRVQIAELIEKLQAELSTMQEV